MIDHSLNLIGTLIFYICMFKYIYYLDLEYTKLKTNKYAKSLVTQWHHLTVIDLGFDPHTCMRMWNKKNNKYMKQIRKRDGNTNIII